MAAKGFHQERLGKGTAMEVVYHGFEDPAGDESILDEAVRVTSQEREVAYGHALINHERIAKIWSVVLGVEVTPAQVALCMIGTKLARLANPGNELHRDSVVDIAGYARAYQRITGL